MVPRARWRAACAIVLCAAIASTGCVSAPYEYSQDVDTELTLLLKPGEEQIERGQPNAFLDGIGHYLISLPSKIVLLRWDVNDHDISEETEHDLRQYLAANDLQSVKVRLNQYAPGDEWSRLARNREMPAFWRWTLGLVTVLFYTIVPDRFFAGLLGGDNYNPFTNTINLYSDNVAVAMHEAGHAKDFAVKRNRHWKGAYSALRLLPPVPLWQEAVASNDAVSYLYEKRKSPQRRTAYRSLYPAYGTYVGGFGFYVSSYFPISPNWVPYAIAYGPVLVGHVIGQTRALFVPDEIPVDDSMWIPPTDPEPAGPEPAMDPVPEASPAEEPPAESADDIERRANEAFEELDAPRDEPAGPVPTESADPPGP